LHTATTVQAASYEKVKVKSTPSVVPIHYMQVINIFSLHLPFIDFCFLIKIWRCVRYVCTPVTFNSKDTYGTRAI